jgi:hypothetical protein
MAWIPGARFPELFLGTLQRWSLKQILLQLNNSLYFNNNDYLLVLLRAGSLEMTGCLLQDE